MGNVFGYGVCVVGAGLCLVLWIMVLIRVIGSRFAAVKSAEAVVVHKEKSDDITYSKWQSLFPRKRYTVVFDISGERKLFDVSEFSYYNSYKKGQRGTLKYRGNTIIDFG